MFTNSHLYIDFYFMNHNSIRLKYTVLLNRGGKLKGFSTQTTSLVSIALKNLMWS